MGRGWRPILVGGAVVVATFALAQAQIFAPSAPAGGAAAGDVDARRDGLRSASARAVTATGGEGGGVGPPLVETGLDAAAVDGRRRSRAAACMPAGLVTGPGAGRRRRYVVSDLEPVPE